MFNNLFFNENYAVYEIMWKYVVEPERIQMTIRRMRFACIITKATNTRSEYAIFIAFTRRKWFSNAPHWYGIGTYIASLVFCHMRLVFLSCELHT